MGMLHRMSGTCVPRPQQSSRTEWERGEGGQGRVGRTEQSCRPRVRSTAWGGCSEPEDSNSLPSLGLPCWLSW